MANVFAAKLFTAEEAERLASLDPQPTYGELAAQCPVHRGPDGTLTLMRMADVLAVNKRRDVLGPGANGLLLGGRRPLIPLHLDGPEHLKFRRILDPLFSATKVALLEPQVRELADELIDAFIDDKRADLRSAFCEPLPSLFFLRIMGMPASDLSQFLGFKDTILGRMPPELSLPERMARMRAASDWCYAYFERALAARTGAEQPGDDLVGWLLHAEVDGERLTPENILDILYLMVIAGLDTVAASLSCMLARLVREPALRRRLVAEPALWARAVDELLRFESPVQTGFRTPTVELEVAKAGVPAGTTFFVCWASANLDPDAFPDPLRIDLERRPNPHVAFGSGIHRCLGLHLARMELRVALERLHQRLPEYALEEGHTLTLTGMPRSANALPMVWS